MKPERRRHPRYQLTLRGKGANFTVPAKWSKEKKEFEVKSGDVSLGGMQVHFHERVKAGDRIRLMFPVSKLRWLRLESLVRWARQGHEPALGSVSAGVAFESELSEKQVGALLKAAERGGGKIAARQVNLPWGRSIEISLRSLRIRLARSAVTALVIALATGFVAYLFSADAVKTIWASGEAVRAEDAAAGRWVAFVSLLVAVVGITNTLHMTVAERYREIGTMKCLGALNRFVVRLFLLEALAMGALGAGLGAAGGIVAALLEGWMGAKDVVGGPIPWLALGRVFLLALGTGLGLTLFGSIYPSLKAASMAPAEAMRTEV